MARETRETSDQCPRVESPEHQDRRESPESRRWPPPIAHLAPLASRAPLVALGTTEAREILDPRDHLGLLVTREPQVRE